MRRLPALIVLGLALAACTRSEPPAPVTSYGIQAPAGGVVTVQAGDTLFAISRRYDVPLRDLIDLNGLAHPYIIQVGQRLTLPAARIHRVAQGDTLYSISRQHGVDTAELVRLNRIDAPYTIIVGQELRLPTASGQMEVAAAPTAPVATSVLPVPAPKPASVLASPAPPAGQPATATAGIATSSVAAKLPPPAGLSAPVPTTVAASPVPVAPEPARQVPAAVKAPAAPSGAVAFIWPVDGKVVSGFGPKSGGQHNDGINIAAPEGTPVRAAEGGTVVYAGNEFRGYGNLLLIRHGNTGWMTAYAHNAQLLVKVGDTVARGQTIATVGSTGSVDQPQLHFEIRKGSRAIDPMEQLRGAQVIPASG